MIRLSLHDQFREKDTETKLNMIFQYLMATDRKVAKICQYIDHERGAGGFHTASTVDQPSTTQPNTFVTETPAPSKTITHTPTPTTPKSDLKKASVELKQGSWVIIEGTMKDDPVQKDVNTQYGPGTVSSFRMNTVHGEVKVSLWNGDDGNFADDIMQYTAGEKLHITSLRVKQPYDGLTQLSSGKYTKITPI